MVEERRSGGARSPRPGLTDLIDAETYLSIHVRIELAASLRRIRSAIDILAA